jgi:hypothetical protein
MYFKKRSGLHHSQKWSCGRGSWPEEITPGRAKKRRRDDAHRRGQ